MTKKYFSALLSMTLVLSVLPQSVAYAKDFTIRDVEEGGASNSYLCSGSITWATIN